MLGKILPPEVITSESEHDHSRDTPAEGSPDSTISVDDIGFLSYEDGEPDLSHEHNKKVSHRSHARCDVEQPTSMSWFRNMSVKRPC